MKRRHLCVFVIAGVLTCMAAMSHAQEDRAVMVARAWDALNGRKYEEAIKAASECVEQFGRQATRDQQKIEASKERPLPPGRADPNSAAAKATSANGVLNDTAACMIVLAKSQERIGQCSEARATYQTLSQLTHARIWDPQGWFWSPSETATDAVERLKSKCP